LSSLRLLEIVWPARAHLAIRTNEFPEPTMALSTTKRSYQKHA
jgi:hypothetical protein